MPAPSSLPEALLRHAVSDPESPWLFRPEGLDWRWHSFGEMAAWMALDADFVAGLPGDEVAIPFAATPAWMSLDLALQATERISAVANALPDLLDLPPRPGAPGSPYRRWRQIPLLEPPPEPGGVRLRDSTGLPLVWSASDLVEEGEALGAEIEHQGGAPPGGREIALWSGPPDQPASRAFLAWATLRGAALILEPDPYSRIATTLWARPTVFFGDAADLAALRQSLEDERPRRWFRRSPSLPLKRLRAVVHTGASELPESEGTFWRGRGVAVIAAERRERGI